MHFLYNSGIQLYELAIRTAALFNPKAKNWIDGRKDYFERLPKIPIEFGFIVLLWANSTWHCL
jgi:hypothetical protein